MSSRQASRSSPSIRASGSEGLAELIRRASAAPNLEPTLGHKLRAIDLSLAVIDAKAPAALAGAVRDLLKAEHDQPPSAVSLAEQSATRFRAFSSPLLPRREIWRPTRRARAAALAATNAMPRDADYPLLVNLREVAEAELALAEHHAADAIVDARRANDGTELYRHVTSR